MPFREELGLSSVCRSREIDIGFYGEKREGVSDLVTAGINFAVVKSFSRLTGSNNERQRESKEKGYKNTHFDGKVTDPNCSNFPCVEAFLYLCPGIVEVDFVGRFMRTVRVLGKGLSIYVG